MNPPHGIFDLVSSPTLGLTKALLIGLAVLLALGALGVLLYLRKGRRDSHAVLAPPDPWKELQAEFDRGLTSASEVERFHAMEHSLRKALDLRYQEGFRAKTVAEVKEALRQGRFSSDFQAECAQFLERAEHALYATHPTQAQDSRAWQDKVSSWMHSLAEGRAL